MRRELDDLEELEEELEALEESREEDSQPYNQPSYEPTTIRKSSSVVVMFLSVSLKGEYWEILDQISSPPNPGICPEF